MKIPLALTSPDRLGDSGFKARSWLEAFNAPYPLFKEASTTIQTGVRKC